MSDQFRRSIASVACVALLALAACNESYVSTETGNPPVIDSSAVALVVTSDSVHVRGEPGAVMPPEGEIEVTNISNDAVETGPVESDGSFDIEVNGSVNDVFEVRVVWNGERSEAVYVIRGGAAIGAGDGGTLSCEQRWSLALTLLEEVASEADRGCEVDADCMVSIRDVGCASSCDYDYLSEAGIAEVSDASDSITGGLCTEPTRDECPTVFGECLPPLAPRCAGGECVGAGASCTACLESDIEWRVTSPGILPALVSNDTYTLTGCNELTVSAPGTEPCSSLVTQCKSFGRGGSIEALLEKLADPDVASAFETGGEFGEPEDTSGFVYEITVGGTTVTYRSCAGQTGISCMDSPGFETLLGWLELISIPARSECDGGGTDCAPQVVGRFSGICEDAGPAPFVWDGLSCSACPCCEAPHYLSEEDCNAAYAGCDARSCGGLVGGTCEADEYCAYVPSQRCGVSDQPASCQPRPEACDANLDPVCGCDNQTYSNSCEAALAGMGIQDLGECETP